MALNVLGEKLVSCSQSPITGFFRNGKCDTCSDDQGMHTICVQMTNEFLEFSAGRGNDLSTPLPDYHFPGLVEGDFWCLCLPRWIEAHQAGLAPKVKLEATHISVTEFVDVEVLKAAKA
ncbi:MAG: DUF2237 domain-containing protein [Verrucomicrobia bacterium]|nr:DUF2237 domain-containing protein [Verrucomicrobiota bacterium]